MLALCTCWLYIQYFPSYASESLQVQMCFSLAALSNNFQQQLHFWILWRRFAAFYIITGLFFKLLPISSTQLVRETLKALPPLTCLNPSPSYCYFWVTLDSWALPAWPVFNIRQRQAQMKPEQSNTGSDSTAVIKCMAWLWGGRLCNGDFTFGMCLSSFPFLCDGWTFCTCALCHLHIPACVLHVDLGYRVLARMLCVDLG